VTVLFFTSLVVNHSRLSCCSAKSAQVKADLLRSMNDRTSDGSGGYIIDGAPLTPELEIALQFVFNGPVMQYAPRADMTLEEVNRTLLRGASDWCWLSHTFQCVHMFPFVVFVAVAVADAGVLDLRATMALCVV
jgi:hypothetical protein